MYLQLQWNRGSGMWWLDIPVSYKGGVHRIQLNNKMNLSTLIGPQVSLQRFHAVKNANPILEVLGIPSAFAILKTP